MNWRLMLRSFFFHKNSYYMIYVGFDGYGYQTGLAVSEDLINWNKLGVILKRTSEKRWDSVGQAGTWILKNDDELTRQPMLRKLDGRYWMIYHSYPQNGYENGPAEMGLAWTDDEDLLDWHRLERPVYSWRNGMSWEQGGLYKVSIVANEGLFYMFYNAKDKSFPNWYEQIGLAVSKDLFHWERYSGNPVLRVSNQKWDSQFNSDPFVARDQDGWVMYYFGFDLQHAQEGLALSRDLLHWDKVEEPVISHGSTDEIDEIHAHKPAMIWHEGILYHFYCASRHYRQGDPARMGREFRCISVATSAPLAGQ